MLKSLISKIKTQKKQIDTKDIPVKEEVKSLPKHLKLGVRGEEKAWEYLRTKGFILLEKNWRSHPHEIDLICKHLDTIVFIEVKSRKSHDPQDSMVAFNQAKQNYIVQAAKKYLTLKNLWHKPCRFDLICIYFEHTKVEHFENVIEQEDSSPYRRSAQSRNTSKRNTKGRSLHNSDTTWQPW